jgi:NADPH:quinone reductase-like Zn-dependent oxidoreductase
MVEMTVVGATLVQNCGDSDIGKVVVQVAKERNLQTISIIEDKPGSPDIIEELKALGGDIVVPESYTKTWYFLFPGGFLVIIWC